MAELMAIGVLPKGVGVELGRGFLKITRCLMTRDQPPLNLVHFTLFDHDLLLPLSITISPSPCIFHITTTASVI